MSKKPKRPSTREIQKKFADTAFSVSQERNDFFLPQIVDLVKKEQWLNLHPEYQCRLVWDLKKKSLFIESLLLNIPIPPIFLYESDLSRYEVMDDLVEISSSLEKDAQSLSCHI